MAEGLAFAPVLVAIGTLAGLLAGLFGIGGGLVVVPALFFLLLWRQTPETLAMAVAIATSLVAIVPTALSSARAHHRLGNIDWPLVRRWIPAMLVGVLLGSALVAQVRSPGFILAFGVLLLSVAVHKLWHGRTSEGGGHMPPKPVQWLAASVIGCVSAIAGVGGGATGVPTLTAMGVPIHRAVGTCAALGLTIAVPAATVIILLASTPTPAAPPGTYRLVFWPALVFMVPFTVLMAPVGAKLGKRLSPQTLTRLFAGALIVVGGRMVYASLA